MYRLSWYKLYTILFNTFSGYHFIMTADSTGYTFRSLLCVDHQKDCLLESSTSALSGLMNPS